MGKDYNLYSKNVEEFLKSQRFQAFIQKMSENFDYEKNSVLKTTFKDPETFKGSRMPNSMFKDYKLSNEEALRQMKINIQYLERNNVSVEAKVESINNLFALSDMIEEQELIDIDSKNYTPEAYRVQSFSSEMALQIKSLGDYIDNYSDISLFSKSIEDEYNNALENYKKAQNDLEKQVNTFVAEHPEESYDVSKLSKGIDSLKKKKVLTRDDLFENIDFGLDYSVNAGSAFSEMEKNYDNAVENEKSKLKEATDALQGEYNKAVKKINESIKNEIDNVSAEYKESEEKYNTLNKIIEAEDFDKSIEKEESYKTFFKNVENAGKLLENNKIDGFDFLKSDDEMKKHINDENSAFFEENIKNVNERLEALDGKKAELDELEAEIKNIKFDPNGKLYEEGQIEFINENVSEIDNLLKNKNEATIDDISDYIGGFSLIRGSGKYTEDLKEKCDAAKQSLEEQNQAYQDLGDTFNDKNYNKLADLFESFNKNQAKFSKEIEDFNKKQKQAINKMVIGMPDNLNESLWNKINDNCKNGDYKKLSENLREIKVTLQNNLSNLTTKTEKIEKNPAFKKIENNLSNYYVENLKFYQEISKYTENFNQIENAENSYKQNREKVNSSLADFKQFLTNKTKELGEYVISSKNREKAMLENEAAKKTESLHTGYKLVENEKQTLNAVKEALKSGVDFIKNIPNTEYSKNLKEFASSSEKHNEYFSKLKVIKEKSDSLKEQAYKAKNDKLTQIQEASKKNLFPYVVGKPSLEKMKADAQALREFSVKLKEALNPLNNHFKRFQNSLDKRREILSETQTKETINMNSHENALFDNILNSKKAIGSDSDYFKNIKTEIESFRDFKASVQSDPGKINSQYEKQAEKLLTALNTYIENRDTSDGKKITKIGQQRLEDIKNLKSAIENRITMINSYKQDLEKLELLEPKRFLPKTRLEATIVENRQEENGIINCKGADKELMKKNEKLIENYVLKEKNSVKEKTSNKSVVAPEKKNDGPVAGK